MANSGLQTKVAIGNNILDSHQEELFQVCVQVPFPQEINLKICDSTASLKNATERYMISVRLSYQLGNLGI